MNADRQARLVRNETAFRALNELLASNPASMEGLTAICECADAACTALIQVPRDDYERVRTDGSQFVIVPGHEVPAIEVLVRREAEYSVVRKTPEAMAAAEL